MEESSPAAKKDYPSITVVMPVLNEASFIGRSLGAVLAQDYPQERLEVIVADGLSQDTTREIVRSMQSGNSNLKLIDNPKKIPASGLNAAIKIAKGEIIVRVDGHTLIDRDYIRRCVEALEESGADAVSGPMHSVGENYVSKAIALAVSSPFGTGDAKLHHLGRSQYSDTTFMGTFRKEVLFRAGLFNENLVRHQDYELNYRIRKIGGKIFLSRKIHSIYYVRSNLAKLWRQYFQYGFWKARAVKSGLVNLNFRYAIPPLFVLSSLVWIITLILGMGLARMLTLIPLGYVIFLIIGSLAAAKTGPKKYISVLPAVFLCLHLSAGLGMWAGLLSKRLRPDRQ